MAIRGLPRRFRFPWRTVFEIHRDVDDELAFHLDMRVGELQRQGLAVSDARREALRQFGDLDVAKKEIKAFDRRFESRRRRSMMWDELKMDARSAWRSLRKRPAFSGIAILVLALGIGVNSAMFSLVDMLTMKPLVIVDPEELVGVYSRDTEQEDRYRSFSYPSFRDIREQNDAFSHLTGFTLTTVGLGQGEITQRTMAGVVSSGYFDTFGVPPTRGRAFTLEEEIPGAEERVVVVSHGLWQRHGGRDDFLGSTLRLNGRPATVVGIAAEGFTGTTAMFSPEIWLPLGMFDSLGSGFGAQQIQTLDDRENYSLIMLGRLRAGMTAERALPGLQQLAIQLEERFPKAHENQTIHLAPMARLGISTSPTSESLMLVPAVMLLLLSGAVLLIACLNLTNMFLARGESRRSEIALRVALGGGRARLIRQQLSEGVLLSFLGGAAGLLIAYGFMRVLVASITTAMPMGLTLVIDPVPDVRVAAATLIFCIVATLLFAFVPAWRQTSGDVFAGLKDHSHSAESASGRLGRLTSLRGLLVVSQVALSMVLLTAAGLFVRGAMAAAEATPGFDLENSFLVELDTGLLGYDEIRGRQIYQQTKERLSTLPGVKTVGMSSLVPYGAVTSTRNMRRPDQSDEDAVNAHRYVVGADYFDSLGLSILSGRAFTETETWSEGGTPVAIIDRPLAQELWPDEDPVGRFVQQVTVPPAAPLPPLEVIGVVPGVAHDFNDEEPPPHIYVAFGQNWRPGMHLHVRLADGAGSAEGVQAAMLRTIRDEIRAVDAGLPVLSLRTMLDHRDESVFMWIVQAGGKAFATLGALALFLALVGVYGVKAYITSRRTREVGVRLALGATPSLVMRELLRDGLQLTFTGLAVGLLLAFGVGRLLASMLYQVDSGDPLVFGIAAAVLTLSALVAAWIPVRRACRIEPTQALRHE
ncbi:MAG: ABC transporter permease [Thermoanaerobaculia bacterium]|nr:ABC transporter permease [Thermoanaerobaculia bacterium]